MVSFQMKLMVLLPKPSAVLSMIGSYCMIRELFADRFYRGDKVIPRVLFTLSVGGLFRSFGWFLTTWPSPKEIPYLWLNVGNTATCTMQGFFIQLGLLLSLGSNCHLFFCYLLMLRYSWPDFKLAKREWWGHGIVVGFALISAIFPLFWEMYNNFYPICWIVEFPLGCRGDECIRGRHAWLVSDLYAIIPIWSTVGVAIISMSMIYCSVRRLEHRNALYAGSRSMHVTMASQSRFNLNQGEPTAEMSTSLDRTCDQQTKRPPSIRINRKKSRAVAAQAYWYVGAFFAAYILDLVGNIISWSSTIWNWPLNLASFALMPLQPLFNFFVFCRSRQEMKTPEARLLWNVFCCCKYCLPCLRSTKQTWMRWLKSLSQRESSNADDVQGAAQAPALDMQQKTHGNNGKPSRVPSESVEIAFVPDSQFEATKRSRVASESVEIAFGPDSQFETAQEGAVTSTIVKTASTFSYDVISLPPQAAAPHAALLAPQPETRPHGAETTATEAAAKEEGEDKHASFEKEGMEEEEGKVNEDFIRRVSF